MSDNDSRRHLEFWPDYAGALLHDHAEVVALDGLGLPTDVVEQARRWVALYDDSNLDPASRDEAWIADGQRLFRRLRAHLAVLEIELDDWEGYWSDAKEAE